MTEFNRPFQPKEHSVDKEVALAIERFRVFWHGHGYQPWRKLGFEGDKQDIFDISENWNKKVTDECYRRLVEPIVQDFDGQHQYPPLIESPFFSFHLFGSIRSFIKEYCGNDWDKIKEAVRKQPIPILDPICHPILPLLPAEIQEILIEAGIHAWENDYDIKLRNKRGKFKKPVGFWLPEMAVNQITLNVLAKKGIHFVFLRREQIEAGEEASIYEIETDTQPIYAFVTDTEISNAISGGTQTKDAEDFYRRHQSLIDNRSRPPMLANDVETIDHHHPMMRFFFNYLFRNIFGGDNNPDNRFTRGTAMIKRGKVIDNTSWTCPHGLGRWTGENGCQCHAGGGIDDHTIKDRKDHYMLLRSYLDNVVNRLHVAAGERNWQMPFTRWLVEQHKNLSCGWRISLASVDASFQSLFKELLINIAGLQSCGWYFGKESNLERDIPQGCLQALRLKTTPTGPIEGGS